MASALAALAIDDPAWVQFVASHPSATFAHHPSWAMILGECYGYRPLALVAIAGAGEIIAGAPFIHIRARLGAGRLVALPFTDRCEPLTSGAFDFLAALRDFRTQGRTQDVGLRWSRGGSPDEQRVVGFSHTISLERPEDDIFSGFSRMHRQNIRIAQRGGVEVRIGSGPDDLERFYALHLMTRRRLGVAIHTP